VALISWDGKRLKVANSSGRLDGQQTALTLKMP
jgi:hypothetical protein